MRTCSRAGPNAAILKASSSSRRRAPPAHVRRGGGMRTWRKPAGGVAVLPEDRRGWGGGLGWAETERLRPRRDRARGKRFRVARPRRGAPHVRSLALPRRAKRGGGGWGEGEAARTPPGARRR